jgi:hypothetical protein
MANDPQSLREFADNLLSDISSGSISIYEAIAAASQYSYLRELIEGQKETLGQAEIMGENELIKVFTEIINQGSEKLLELPNFQSQLPDQVLLENEVKAMGEVRKHASLRIKQTAAISITNQKERRRTFVHDLVTRFSSTIPTLSEDRVGTITDSALIAASGEATQKQTKERFAELIIASNEITGGQLTQQQTNQLKTNIAEALETNGEYISGVTQQTKRAAILTAALYDDIDMKRPDVFVDVVLSAPPTEKDTETLTRANKLARIAESLETKQERGSGLNFFSATNAKGAAKGLQQGADGLLSLVGEPLREMVIHEKVNGTLRSMLTSAQSFTDRLGENFVHSALFTNISQNLTRQLSEKPRSGQARSLVGDVFSTVFRGPLDPVLTHGTKERVLDYFELARASATSPKGRGFLPTNIAPWDIFRVTESAATRSARRGRKTASFIPWFGLGSLSNVMSNAVGSLVDRSASFFLTNPFIPRQLSSSRRAAAIPIPMGQDMPLLVSIIVIVALVLLFVFPSPLNLSLISHSAKVSAILASLRSLKQEVNEVAANATTFSCVWSGTSPVAPITTCPVSAPISQGPYTSSGSHKTLNAWDFAASQGTPVVAAHDAYVASYANSYAPYQYKAASYGNNVVLVATDPTTKQQYCTNYAHLLDVSPVVAANSGSPTLIPAGTVIGYVDTTGYTYGCIAGKCGEGYGTHLHWGYKGPNQNVPVPLPPGCQ